MSTLLKAMEHIIKTIDQANQKIRELEVEIISNKKLVNQLCAFAKLEPQYADEALQPEGATQLSVRRNSFFGKPLSTCVRDYLEMLAKAHRQPTPASLDDILGALKTGGFDLDQISKNEMDQKRGLAITLGKNSVTFIRLPNADWGLVDWYPGYKDKRKKKAENGKDEASEAGEVGDDLLGGSQGDLNPVEPVEPPGGGKV